MNRGNSESLTAISVDNLRKSFGSIQAVDGLSFSVPHGDLFGFLGPNGAGKTTTIGMLTGLIRPDSGAIQVKGIDFSSNPTAAKSVIGVVPDESNLYPELTGFENLCFCAALYGIGKTERQKRARNLLKTFDLGPAGSRKFGGYSRGMKRKLTIAAAIIHNPAILFLDEPTTGIDVESARRIRQMIADLNESGKTIMLTTHYIEEAERLCKHVAFVVSGKIVQIDTVENLVQPLKDRHVVQIAYVNALANMREKLTASFPRLEFQSITSTLIRVEASEPIRVGPLVRFLEDQGAEVAEARKMRPSLEDVFVRMTGIEAKTMIKEKEKAGGGQ